MRKSLCLGAALVLTACSAAPWRPVTDWVQVWQLVNRADGLAQDGDHAGARVLYEQVVQEYPTSPWAPTALFRLARLEVSPGSPVRNYRQAHEHFDRLVKDYPDSQYDADARAWRDTLGQLLAREQEAARIRQDMERLKRVEIRLEQENQRAPEEAPR
ncbi:MAG: tetratricopeptide repeat protein [Candidatus Rokubacteria bacterium]|nr:tetratricopeptide repeat protein [Candidatus Rokubacteria bacterium]